MKRESYPRMAPQYHGWERGLRAVIPQSMDKVRDKVRDEVCFAESESVGCPGSVA